MSDNDIDFSDIMSSCQIKMLTCQMIMSTFQMIMSACQSLMWTCQKICQLSGTNWVWKRFSFEFFQHMNKWHVDIKIWQVNIIIWHVNIKICQVNMIIWQVIAGLCHHIIQFKVIHVLFFYKLFLSDNTPCLQFSYNYANLFMNQNYA